MQGWHLTADLHGCALDTPHGSDLMRDPKALRTLCIAAVAASGLTAVAECFHRFAEPGGITGVVLLAESHVAVHTWPEQDAVTLDVYVCNVGRDNSAAAQGLMQALINAFAPRHCVQRQLERGDLGRT